MTGAEQRIADLEHQVADLTATVHRLCMESIVLHVLEESLTERQAGPCPAVPPRRPRHLHAVGGTG
jgi:hypothetical protein